MEDVRKMTEQTPALQDLTEKLEGADKLTAGELKRPGDIRYEAIKKIDRLADAVKQKRKSGKYDAVNEMRKRLRRLKVPKSIDAPTQRLAEALNKGDFKSAKEEIKRLREQLATLKSEQDKELVAKMGKQLDQLAKQLENVAKDEKLAKKLEDAGIKKEDVDRMLENLSKKDLDQLKKQLEEKGMDQKQIQKIAKQMQQQQQAGKMAKQMAKSMSQCAQCAKSGQTGEAAAGLSAAADQLGELEQLEQEMNQIESTMAGLQEAKQDLERPCPG
jgi:chromosome segregation ATPase